MLFDKCDFFGKIHQKGNKTLHTWLIVFRLAFKQSNSVQFSKFVPKSFRRSSISNSYLQNMAEEIKHFFHTLQKFPTFMPAVEEPVSLTTAFCKRQLCFDKHYLGGKSTQLYSNNTFFHCAVCSILTCL